MIIALSIYIAIPLVLIWLITIGIQKGKESGGILNIIRAIYVLAIAGFLVGLVTTGISAFHEAPERPEYTTAPPLLRVPVKPTEPPVVTPEYEEWLRQQDEWQAEYSMRWDAHKEAMKDYHRNVFFISYPFGLLFVALGLLLRPRLDILRPGLI
ncbi:MAG: hypothetical protein V3S51_06830, partial [Dehalococcoidia bacterium]